jgi:hypothetical protein
MEYKEGKSEPESASVLQMISALTVIPIEIGYQRLILHEFTLTRKP